jgi:hypothetical protein
MAERFEGQLIVTDAGTKRQTIVSAGSVLQGQTVVDDGSHVTWRPTSVFLAPSLPGAARATARQTEEQAIRRRIEEADCR